MRGAARGGWTALAATVVLCTAVPAGAATLPAQAVLEPSFGALIPIEGWVIDRPAPDLDDRRPPSVGDLLAPAFAANFVFAYVFPVGGDGPCCRLGLEIGLSYVYWDADDPTGDEYAWDRYGYGGDLTGGMLRVLVGMRLLVDYDWGYVVGRLAMGPEIAALREAAFDEVESDVGPAVLLGGGVGFRVADFLAIGLLASFVAAFHEDTHGYPSEVPHYYDEHGVYFTYDSLAVELSVATSWFF